MIERWILFTDRNVRAILAGRKTQTRRCMKFPSHVDVATVQRATLAEWCDGKADQRMADPPAHWALFKRPVSPDEADGRGVLPSGVFALRNPYGFVPPVLADSPEKLQGVPVRLWVKETWAGGVDGTRDSVDYRADGHIYGHDEDGRDLVRWRSPLFMPRWASRLTLDLTAVRAHRLQDITADDAIAEGLERVDAGCWQGGGGAYSDPVRAFASSWDALYRNRKSNRDEPHPRWDDNPWVWAYTFRPLEVK